MAKFFIFFIIFDNAFDSEYNEWASIVRKTQLELWKLTQSEDELELIQVVASIDHAVVQQLAQACTILHHLICNIEQFHPLTDHPYLEPF